MNVKEGDVFPNFSLIDDAGRTVTREDIGGKISVVYFYPKDNTSGCTTEACSFRDDMAKFTAAGISVYGISTDNINSHMKFKQKNNLNFTLLSDEHKTLVAQLGIKSFLGVAKRVTFILDSYGKILKIYPKVSPAGHAEEILSFINGLQKSN
jgi:peroxiredoxin Q/BCP